MKSPIMLLTLGMLWGCANHSTSIYQQLGGEKAIAQIVENFIHEIQFDEYMFSQFKDSDINRFREKMAEHLCMLADGPCQYTGDDMQTVHEGMNITENQFNHSVDLFIKAMDKANIPHTIQNKFLAKIAPSRKDMIYR